MNRRVVLYSIAGIALVALSVLGIRACSGPSRPVEVGIATPGTKEVVLPEETVAVELYFPGRGNRLHGEERRVAAAEPLETRVHLLVEELLRGPAGPALYSPLPAGVLIAGVHVDDRAVAYLDLTPPEGSGPPSWGSKRELLAVYSLVDSILLNLPEIERVVLLWNSRQRTTFAGHVDTTRPLGSNSSYISSRKP